ncbi:helix-turn-helix domain-containing protein [Streptomyces sp. NPDC048172]|uniref:helix-turn-helix domain-containing protein n=1 Tax=Streptomyces sp. NPDC048172 TaxID=3365505 RepID=UPI0037101E23
MSIGNSPEEDRPPVGDEHRPPVGRALQQARIDARLTVDEISTSTRVRVPIVQAIEQDDFSRCGGDVYARGHIRTLARAVGLDADALVAQYDEEHGGRPAPTPPATLFEAERIRPEPRRPNWTAAMVAAIVVVIGFVGFTLVNGGGGEDSGGAVAEKTPSQAPSKKETGKPSPSKTADPKPSDSAIAGAPADKVTVRMTAEKGGSWVSAKDHNGRLVHEGVLRQGQSKTLTDDKRLDLVLGNAGGVKLYVNGKEVKDVGQVGQVQRVSYTRGDPEAG